MCAKKTGSIEDLAVVGVDIGKDTFHLVGFDRSGQVVLRKQIKRLALDATFEKLPRCVVGMEACLSAHFVSRRLRDMGFIAVAARPGAAKFRRADHCCPLSGETGQIEYRFLAPRFCDLRKGLPPLPGRENPWG